MLDGGRGWVGSGRGEVAINELSLDRYNPLSGWFIWVMDSKGCHKYENQPFGHIKCVLYAYVCLLLDFEKMTKETSKYNNVFFEEKKVCNRGRARYQLDLAPYKKFPVTEDFSAAVCGLPDSYSERTYYDFIERWGTVGIMSV